MALETVFLYQFGPNTLDVPIEMRTASTYDEAMEILHPAEPDPDPDPPSTDPRTVIDASEMTGTIVLEDDDTIWDFGGSGATASRDITITGSNSEARNIAGSGARRIGQPTGAISVTDSGFRDFEFTFAHVRMNGGATITRPYFIGGIDVNSQPHEGEGDIMQIFAYEGDIISPLIAGCVIYGKERPDGSDSHNDGIQFTGISGGVVHNPTIYLCVVEGASSAAIQAKHVAGTFAIVGCQLSERFESFHAVIAKPQAAGAEFWFQGNTLVDGASVAATGGWVRHPNTDDPLPAGVTIA